MLSFLPDADELTPEVLVECDDMVPTVRGYAAAPSGVASTEPALGAACTGASLLLKLDGSTRLIAGTTTALYESATTSWTDVSRGAAYSTGDVPWRMAQFGNTSLAICKSVVMQYSASGAFADVTAPKASVIETASGFVMLADCDDTGSGVGTSYGDQPHRWWCSAINDYSSWVPSVTTQCTSGLLVDTPGAILGLRRLGADVIAYKKRSIYRGTYVGPPEVWRWTLISSDIGAVSQESIVSVGYAHYFVGDEDIYGFDGTTPVSISAGVREWFFARLNKTYAYKIRATHDRLNGRILWHYPTTGATLDSVLVYDYRTKRWGHIDRDVEVALEFQAAGLTYDSLGSSYATYEDLPAIAYDSPFWAAGNPVPAYIDTSHVIRSLTGPAGASGCKTGYVGDPERMTFVSRVRPHYRLGKAPASAILTPSFQTARGDTFTTGEITSVDGTKFDVLQEGRWHQWRFDWTGEVEVVSHTVTAVNTGYE